VPHSRSASPLPNGGGLLLAQASAKLRVVDLEAWAVRPDVLEGDEAPVAEHQLKATLTKG
jgi:hypothetical protein